MRGYVINHYVHPKDLTLSLHLPEPTPGPGEVLVDVYSAALNFFDILQSQGKYQAQPPFPFVLGTELAGKIADNSPIPEGCPFKPGQRVFGSAQGSYADRVCANWVALAPLPANMTFDQGAGIHITWPTSYEGLVGRAGLKAGEWVLITAAAGGVGISAVQLAKTLGANVIAAAGSQAKLDICKKYGGADYSVDYTQKDWQKEVLKITGGKGVDVVYDPVGLIADCLKCIAWKGRALVIGFAAGKIEKLPLNLVLLKNISIIGLHWGAYYKKEPGHISSVFDALFDLFSSKRVKPVIYTEVFPLEELPRGLVALERRETWGKVILHVKDEHSRDGAKL